LSQETSHSIQTEREQRSCRVACVDLNPIRARIAETPETSRFTSAYERIQALREEVTNAASQSATQPQSEKVAADVNVRDAHSVREPATARRRGEWLSPFELSEAISGTPVPNALASNKGCLPMSFAEYLNLLDWTGRQLRADKRGAIPRDLAPILQRLHIGGEEGWMQLMGQFSRLFRRAAGRPNSLQLEREQRGCRVMQGIRHSRGVFF
jgi:hypothetical protein